MATDLDRAYVINGDDLRIALAGMNGRWPAVANPRTMAGDIIEVIGQPLGKVAGRVTREQLAGAIETVRDRVPEENLAPDALAKRLLAALPDGDDEPETNTIGIDHVCEHLIGDREVQLMVDILRGMAGLDHDARQRIRNWVDERFVPRGHPF